MIEIHIDKVIPYTFEIVLSQYFDYEHIAHVHPKTVGEYRLVEVAEDFILYDHLWPRSLFGQKRSRVRHTFEAPNKMTFAFEEGYIRGTRVDTVLHDQEGSTLVNETYRVPAPDWFWLRPLIRRWTVRNVERIWNEDLDVEVCREGWPGVPECMRSRSEEQPNNGSPAQMKHAVGDLDDFPPGVPKRVEIEGREVLVLNKEGEILATANRCPHTGGPLHLGEISGAEVTCPWHGAKFDLRSGTLHEGPCDSGIECYPVTLEAGRVVLDLNPGSH